MTDPHSELEQLNIAFRTKSVGKMTPEQRTEFLDFLCNLEISNPQVQHRAVVRALAITHAEMEQVIEDLNERNSKLQCWFMVFAGVGVLGAIAQVLATLKAFGLLGK